MPGSRMSFSATVGQGRHPLSLEINDIFNDYYFFLLNIFLNTESSQSRKKTRKTIELLNTPCYLVTHNTITYSMI